VLPHPTNPVMGDAMGYLIVATAQTMLGKSPHSVRTRWRSDDPWGAIWRCLYDAMHPYIPMEIDVLESKDVCQLTLTVRFEPDKEDFALLLTERPAPGQPLNVRARRPGKELLE
jgi:hypothetical protein